MKCVTSNTYSRVNKKKQFEVPAQMLKNKALLCILHNTCPTVYVNKHPFMPHSRKSAHKEMYLRRNLLIAMVGSMLVQRPLS